MPETTYPYANSEGVLHNKLGITDRATLARVEYDYAALREQSMPQLGKTFDLGRLQAIHKHLFDDVYAWAGKLRTVPLSKFNPTSRAISVFSPGENIVSDWKALEHKIGRYLAREPSDFAGNRAALVAVYIEGNRIHPFPEGNGRSLQIFMRALAREQGIELDYSKTSASEWNRASALSVPHGRLFERTQFVAAPTEFEPIGRVFDAIALPKERGDPDHQPFVMGDTAKARFDEGTVKVGKLLQIVERDLRSKGLDDAQVKRALVVARRVLNSRDVEKAQVVAKVADPAPKTAPKQPPYDRSR